MKKLCLFSLLMCSMLAGMAETVPFNNPLFTNFTSPKWGGESGTVPMYTADPSAHVFNGRLYVYASHDMVPAVGCDHMDQYHVFSTTDLTTWTDHGLIFGSDQVEWGRSEGGFMWAPDCAYNPADQTYYYYFPHPTGDGDEWDTTWKIGVATSSDPATGFTQQGYIEGLESLIDPCVFVDGDGQPYIYHGGGGICKGGRLKKSNWKQLDGSMTAMTGLSDFHEGTWVFKRNGVYYLMYADNHGLDGNQLKYAMGNSPLGPWTSKGVILYATGCATSHGSIVEYNGQWYLFYHSSNASGINELRSVCVDKLYFNEDGTIQVVKNWGEPYNGTHTVTEVANTTDIALTLQAEDFNTGMHYGYWDTTTGNSTNAYRTDVNVDINTENSTTFVGNMENGEWLRYTVNVAKAGLYDIDFYVASGNGNGKFHVSVNGTQKTAEISVPNTDGWTLFQKLTVPNIPLKEGEQYIDIRISNGFNFDRMEFRNAQPYSGTPYNGPHNINDGAVVEAEDFDEGGEGTAYHDNESTNQSGAYRTNEGVDLENSEGSIHISWSNSGEWTKYTLNVQTAGWYDVVVRVSTGNGAPGSLSLSVDDIDEYDMVSTTTTNWQTYGTVTVKNVKLTAGTHVMTMNIGGNINVDKFTFNVASYTVTVASDDNETGTATGGGTFDGGAQTTLRATPQSGYEFAYWNDGSTQNPRTITVDQSASYVAFFEKTAYLPDDSRTVCVTCDSRSNEISVSAGVGDLIMSADVKVDGVLVQSAKGIKQAVWNYTVSVPVTQKIEVVVKTKDYKIVKTYWK